MNHRNSAGWRTLALYAVTLFLSAFLLFWIQPLVGKRLLPLLGGVPAVWNSCMAFFQALLLFGYAYAHWSATKLQAKRQGWLHVGLLALCILVLLPPSLPVWMVDWLRRGPNPSLWTVAALTVLVGGPFFVLSASAPLLQSWFARGAGAGARDPYVLYAASNTGSLLALLAYPVVLEPRMTLSGQGRYWSAGVGVLAVFIAFCAWWCRSEQEAGAGADERTTNAGANLGAALVDRKDAPDTVQCLRWCGISFVPCSLMLGATTFLATDVASVPLLWVIPLGLYLASFVLAFGWRRADLPSRLDRVLVPCLIPVLYALLARVTEPMIVLIGLHLILLFIGAWFCHAHLAGSRPAPRHLTTFYFCMACGGVLAGGFNAFLAPVVFPGVWEYPVTLVLLCCCRPGNWRWTRVDLGIAAGFALAVGLLVFGIHWPASWPVQSRSVAAFGPLLVAVFLMVRRPVLFVVAVAVLLVSGLSREGPHGRVLWQERNFFGVCRVTLDTAGACRALVHGSTVHGRESTDPARRGEPLSYYMGSGPVGGIFKQFDALHLPRKIGLVGLGAGAMLAYSKPGDDWRIYEIDPAVCRIAADTNWFTFMGGSKAQRKEIILGDARLRLQEAPDRCFGLLVLDAFSSDSIPVHLMTKQAFELYRSKLAPGGMLAMHISNRCLDLEPLVANLAAGVGLVCYGRDDDAVGTEEARLGKEPSHWTVLAEAATELRRLDRDTRWRSVKPSDRPKAWTDDSTDILSVMRW